MDFLADQLLSLDGSLPYVLVFGVLLACGLGLPVPEDVTLIAAGLSAYYGNSNVGLMIAISFLGVLIGDSTAYFLGARYGMAITRRRFFARLFSKERIDYVTSRFHEKGNRILFVARFMPGLRAPIFFTAGTVGVPYRVLLFYDGLAAVLSVPAIVYSAYYFGDEIDRVIRIVRGTGNGIVIVVLLAVAIAFVRWWLKRRKKRLSRSGLHAVVPVAKERCGIHQEAAARQVVLTKERQAGDG